MTALALVASLLMSYPVRWYGYRKTIIFGTVLAFLAGILCSLTNNIPTICVGRALYGQAVGTNSVTSPILLSEISPKGIRGIVTSAHQLSITLGILLSSIIAYIFTNLLSSHIADGWKVVLGLPILFSVLTVILLKWVPESPCWLLREGRYEDAEATLNQIYNVSQSVILAGQHDPQVTEELSSLQTELDNERQIETASWLEVLQSGRIIFISLFLQFQSPFSGINVLMFYSTTIFNIAGLDKAIIGTITIGLLNVIMTVAQMYIVERAGRTKLLNYGTLLCGVSFALLGIVLRSHAEQSTLQGIFAVLFTLLYICGYAVGIGAVPWAIMSEVTPARLRGKAYALAIGENWFQNLIISFITLTLITALGGGTDPVQQKYGSAYLFFIFSFVCIVGTIISYLTIPETKNLPFHEIQRYFYPKYDPRHCDTYEQIIEAMQQTK